MVIIRFIIKFIIQRWGEGYGVLVIIKFHNKYHKTPLTGIRVRVSAVGRRIRGLGNN